MQTLTVDSILDWRGFVDTIQNSAGSDQPKLRRLNHRLSESSIIDNISELAPLFLNGVPKENINEPSAKEFKAKIVEELNKIFWSDAHYQNEDFGNSELTEVEQLLASQQTKSKNQIFKLNRLLLESLFPDEIEKSDIKQFNDHQKEKVLRP